MYLSRLVLSPGRATADWLRNVYQIHQRVRLALPDDPRPLYRLERGSEDGPCLLVQSVDQRPDWETAFGDLPIVERYEFKRYEPDFKTGQTFAFRLRGSPSAVRQGTRYPLLEEAAQYAWLDRKLAAAGAKVVVREIVGREQQRARKTLHGRQITITHHGVLFEGWLMVQEPEKLAAAVRAGVGAAKGLGFGLLSIMSLRQS